MDFDFDHVTQMITALALAYIAYQNHTGNKQAQINGAEIIKTQVEVKKTSEETKKVGEAVNGVLATTKADAQIASDRLLQESVAAALTEGKAKEIAAQAARNAVTEKSRPSA